MNVELLRTATDMAKKDYQHFDMRFWRYKITNTMAEAWSKVRGHDKGKLACGTAGCLAGNICAVALGFKAYSVMDENAIKTTAQALVGLTFSQALDLFSPYSGRYLAALSYKSGTKAYAKAIAEGVEKFIAEETGVAQ